MIELRLVLCALTTVWQAAIPSSSAAPPPVLKGWPDVVDQHATAGVLVTISFVAAAVVVGLSIFVWRGGSRAKAEGREHSAFWGLSHVGPIAPPIIPPPPGVGAPPLSGAISPADRVAKTALALFRASHETAMGMDVGTIADREGYLLTALITGTSDVSGTVRRASILKVQGHGTDREEMVVRRGVPDHLFVKPYRTFSKEQFETHGVGLCWAAVYECLAPTPGLLESIKQRVFHAPDLSKQPSYVHHPGHHQFKSILIAPILAGTGTNRRVLGAVCLDAEGADHYSETDEHLVAIAALALSMAWLVQGARTHINEQREKGLART